MVRKYTNVTIIKVEATKKEKYMNKKLPQVLTKQEQENLLKQFNTRYFTSHRNLVMIKMALKTGMRVSELTSLKFSDITPNNGIWKVHIKDGKGGKDRMLWIGDNLYDEIVELFFSHGVIMESFVFPTNKGTQIKTAYLRRMIKEKGTRAGSPRVHFHLLRHTYLTELYSKTKDIRVVQDVAGHSSINTTMIYTHTSGEGIREAMVG